MDNQRNLILAIALSFLLLLGWTSAMDYFYPQPEQALVEDRADTPTEQASQAATQHSRTGGLASPDRVRIDAPRVAGSVNLRGGVVDDIVLKEYDETTQKDSEPVRIFSPSGTPAQQFAQFGWVGSNLKVPGPQTLWEADGDVLSADTPLTLTHDNGEGLTFSIRYTIDDQYMITAEQTVANTAGNDVVVQPFGLVNSTRGRSACSGTAPITTSITTISTKTSAFRPKAAPAGSASPISTGSPRSSRRTTARLKPPSARWATKPTAPT